MMNLREITDSASDLASHIRCGVPTAEAVGVLAIAQPSYGPFWEDAARKVAAGNPLSDSLGEVWPAPMVSAIKAGEEVGKMDDVFSHVIDTLAIQAAMQRLLRKLIYPGLIALAGLVMFVLIMVFVAPSTARSFRASNANGITRLSLVMESFVLGFWPFIIAGCIGAAVAFYRWATSPAGKNRLIQWALQIPYFEQAVIDLYFGFWARYMAMMTSAGLPTSRAIQVTTPIMPESLRDGLAAFDHDISVRNLPLQDAANTQKMSAGDPRQRWPLFIRRAFITGDRAGSLDTQLLAASPELIRRGTERFEVILRGAEIVATAAAAALVALSFAGIYGPIIGAIKTYH